MDEINLLHALRDAALEINSLDKRIDSIERRLTDKNEWFDYQEQRINELEEILNRITQDDMLAGRKPFKCPTCLGTGQPHQDGYCISCDSKGIVWG